jgi:hypothetical protein
MDGWLQSGENLAHGLREIDFERVPTSQGKAFQIGQLLSLLDRPDRVGAGGPSLRPMGGAKIAP